MLPIKKNLLKATVLLALTCGLTTNLNAQDWSEWINSKRTAVATRIHQWSSRISSYFPSRKRELAQQLREMADRVREEQQRNGVLRGKLGLIAETTGNQEQLWHEVRELIEQGANVNTATTGTIEQYGETKQVNDLTVLHLAAIDKPEMVDFLIERGADRNQKTANGLTYNDIIEAAERIQQGPIEEQPICKKPKAAQSSELNLQLALNYIFDGLKTEHNWEIVRNIIFKNPYLINTEGPKRWTALHLAVSDGDVRMVTFLMGYREANPNLYNNDGLTAFDIANGLRNQSAKDTILGLLTREFSSAQFGPTEEHKSLKEIVQEHAPSFIAPQPTLTAAQELEEAMDSLIKRQSPTRALSAEDVPEAYKPEVPYY